MSALSLEEMKKVLSEPDPSTKDFIFQQTMYRIKDPKVALDFYTRVIGMRLLTRMDFEEMKFTVYFLGFEDAIDIPADDKTRTQWALSRKATLELTHNWGSECDPEVHYHNGNSEPRGFGHIGLLVPDIDVACKRFEQLGVKFIKTPDGGKMKGIAFIQDPDGYWIEVFSKSSIENVNAMKLSPT